MPPGTHDSSFIHPWCRVQQDALAELRNGKEGTSVKVEGSRVWVFKGGNALNIYIYICNYIY